VSAVVLGTLSAAACGGNDPTSSGTPTAGVPVAAFTFAPGSPAANQAVQFSATSTGSPTSWSWSFGDGGISSLQNPTHVFSTAGTFTISLTVANARGSNATSRNVVVNAPAPQLNIVLGRPTNTSVAASVLLEAGTDAYLEYGTAPGTYASASRVATSSAGEPVTLTVDGLRPNTRYYYRARYRLRGEADYRTNPEHSFQTPRAAGATFSFGVQGDSHPEREGKMFSPDLYALNMRNVAGGQPDFYIGLGDDFSLDKLIDRNVLTEQNVNAVYLNQRDFFGIVGHSTPVFLVNGNHEQAAGYLLTGRYQTPYSQAPIYAGRARVTYFPLPATDGFYTADTTEVPGVGLIRDYYAWEWGDALFVVIDPYWHSPVPVDQGVPGVDPAGDPWEITMGDVQYAWFKSVLETSRAKYKFVFAHHVLGSGRGAAALVHTYEWGGYNKAGTSYEFASRRRWPAPVHQLMDENKVAIFFYGHDHLFAREKVDGVVYQAVPNPADNTYQAFNVDAFDPDVIHLPGARYDPWYGIALANAGYLHVTVSPDRVTVSYIRAVLPGDEGKAGAANGAVTFSYAVTPDRATATETSRALREELSR
jgi:PKD repeat protein